MRLLLSRFVSIYKEFPRPVRFVFIFLVILILLILSLSLYQTIQLNTGGGKTDQEISQKILKNRQGPLRGIGGIVSGVEGKGANTSLLTIDADVGKTYYATVDEKTSIFGISRKLTKTEVKTTSKKKTIKDLKVGARIYLQSTKDLLQENKLSAEDIKSIEIYVE